MTRLMGEAFGAAKLVESFGGLGVLALGVFLLWRLADKWASQFLEVQKSQAAAMSELATAVRDTLGDQHELLLAVRVQAMKLEEIKGWMKDLDEHVRGMLG